jgi:hypothetical protein
MNYDKLLDEWADELYKRIDECTERMDSMDEYDYKQGRTKGYQDGLLMAMAILSRLENKHKRKTSEHH